MIQTPIMGDKMTDKERVDCIAAMDASITQICQDAGVDLAVHLKEEVRKLLNSELLDITRGGIQTIRGAKTLLVALAAERIDRQWNSEAIKKEVKRVKRWLKNRY